MMELVLVMLILAMAAAIAAPSLHNFILGRKSRDTAAQVLALGQYARTRAVDSGAVYRLNVDAQARTYWLTRREGAAFKELGEEFGRHFLLPTGCSVRWLAPESTSSGPSGSGGAASFSLTPAPAAPRMAGATGAAGAANANHEFIDFYPDGRIDACALEFTDPAGWTSIGCKSETEPLTILERSAR